MAKIKDLNEPEFEKWLSGRPPVIKELAKRFPPDRLYKIDHTQQRVTIVGYSEDNTLIVNVSAKYNCVLFDRDVFGVPADSLEECDLPAEDEVVGNIGSLINCLRGPTSTTRERADFI